MIFLVGLIKGTEQNVISTAQGKLRGVEHDGYVSYRGIPYATMAAVDGRFKVSLEIYYSKVIVNIVLFIEVTRIFFNRLLN